MSQCSLAFGVEPVDFPDGARHRCQPRGVRRTVVAPGVAGDHQAGPRSQRRARSGWRRRSTRDRSHCDRHPTRRRFERARAPASALPAHPRRFGSPRPRRRRRRSSACAENSALIALMSARVNRANSATEPLTSQSTTSSGRVVRGRRHSGWTGTPPVDSERRMVRRTSSRPRRVKRLRRAPRTASFRASGRSARCSAARSDGLAPRIGRSSRFDEDLGMPRPSRRDRRSRRRRTSCASRRRNSSTRAAISAGPSAAAIPDVVGDSGALAERALQDPGKVEPAKHAVEKRALGILGCPTRSPRTGRPPGSRAPRSTALSSSRKAADEVLEQRRSTPSPRRGRHRTGRCSRRSAGCAPSVRGVVAEGGNEGVEGPLKGVDIVLSFDQRRPQRGADLRLDVPRP